ncbi:MAG: hypothetical protein QM765_30940 [Myxococcales bacterium]
MRTQLIAFGLAAVLLCSCEKAAKPAPAPAATAAVGAAGTKTVLWDGDKTGLQAKGWADCGKKDVCTVSLEARPGVGRGQTSGLEYRVKGSDWMGFGWSWSGWTAPGTDLAPFSTLSFWVQLEAAKMSAAHGLKVRLASATTGPDGKNLQSDEVPLADFVKDLNDGLWHEVRIPIADLTRGKGFDAKAAWELRISSWYLTAQEYTLHVDDIGLN